MDSERELAKLRTTLQLVEREAAMNLARLELQACRVITDSIRLAYPRARFVELGPARHGGCVPLSVRDENMVAVVDADGDRVLDVAELARALSDDVGDVLDLVVDAAGSLTEDGEWSRWAREQTESTPVAQTFLDLRKVDAEADAADQVDEIAGRLASRAG